MIAALVWTALAEYYRWGGINISYILLSIIHSSECWKFKVRVTHSQVLVSALSLAYTEPSSLPS